MKTKKRGRPRKQRSVYAINRKRLEDSGRMFAYEVYSRLCRKPTCRGCAVVPNNLLLGQIKEQESEILQAAQECTDFIGPNTPMLDAIFRVMIMNHNQPPLTIDNIAEKLNETWTSQAFMRDLRTETISRAIKLPNPYYIGLAE